MKTVRVMLVGDPPAGDIVANRLRAMSPCVELDYRRNVGRHEKQTVSAGTEFALLMNTGGHRQEIADAARRAGAKVAIIPPNWSATSSILFTIGMHSRVKQVEAENREETIATERAKKKEAEAAHEAAFLATPTPPAEPEPKPAAPPVEGPDRAVALATLWFSENPELAGRQALRMLGELGLPTTGYVQALVYAKRREIRRDRGLPPAGALRGRRARTLEGDDDLRAAVALMVEAMQEADATEIRIRIGGANGTQVNVTRKVEESREFSFRM